ncbi:hypothetical protein CALCODRAFT_506282 [Calocera cornea HHB12733]|uniref:AB hydrolase-1 domain-containing protein n=1 Tax=Calocera cornea HHB12733 TaxID=1353952 RepID=A0A165J218_9BASI|nr:hypothetical protein CALCODRAFT_506282 [Calocera cornea HHB12733]
MSFTSATVRLPVLVPGDEPAEFRYFDSQPAGAPGPAPKTTIIGVHGVCFDSAFMKYAIEKLGIEPTDKKTKTGGILLLGWSKGCIPPIALMSSMPHVQNPLFPMPSEVSSLQPMLESYLRAILLYEPPGTAAGRAPTKDAEELAVDAAEVPGVFYKWVVKKISPDSLPALNRAWHGEHAAHEFSWLLAPDRPAIEQVAYQAFAPVPPSLGVGLMLGSEASDYCKDVGDWIQARLAHQAHTAAELIPGAGHFAMLTHPDAFTKSVLDIVQKLDV